MSDIRLTVPEGYFEKSFEKTMAASVRIGKRRKTAVCFCAAVVLALGTYFSLQGARISQARKEYLAQQAEIAKLDIFLEVNQ